MSHPRSRNAVLTVAGALLVTALLIVRLSWSPSLAPGRVDGAPADDGARASNDVELVRDDGAPAASGAARLRTALESRPEPVVAPDPEPDGAATLLVDPPDLAATDVPWKERLVPIGDGVVLVLTVVAPEQVPSPRLPAWLELRPDRGPDDARARRVLGTIRYDTWMFVVEDLEPGRHAWTVRTGIAAPLHGGADLALGRNEVELVLADLPTVRIDLVASFPWGEPVGSSAVEDGEDDERPEDHAFGPGVPWLAFEATDEQDAVLVPFESWWRAHAGIVASGQEPVSGSLHDRAFVFGLDAPAPELTLFAGLPRTHAIELGRGPGGARFDAEVSASDLLRAAGPEVRVSVAVRWPSTLDEDPPEVAATLYGCVSKALRGPLDAHGASMWERVGLDLAPTGAATSSGTWRVAASRLPRGARVMFTADGMQPIFHDLDALLEEGEVRLAFEPGTGGVLLAAYQNYRAPNAHWAPGFGFEVRRLDDPRSGPLVYERPPSGPSDAPAPHRVGPLGSLEFASEPGPPFDADHLVLRLPDANRDRTARSIHPVLAVTLRDAAPGVVELFVQD